MCDGNALALRDTYCYIRVHIPNAPTPGMVSVSAVNILPVTDNDLTTVGAGACRAADAAANPAAGTSSRVHFNEMKGLYRG